MQLICGCERPGMAALYARSGIAAFGCLTVLASVVPSGLVFAGEGEGQGSTLGSLGAERGS
jgi:hypothetical protein